MSLTRRNLLQAGLAAGISPVLRPLELLLPSKGFTFAFFSDSHVGLKTNVEPDRAMLEELRVLRPDFAINGGDVTDGGWVGEYRNYWNLIKDLPFKVHHAPGNHDVRWSPLGPKAYMEGTHDKLYSAFEHEGCFFAMLDTAIPLSHYGHFETTMLEWLEGNLKRVGRDTPVFLAFHHWVGREGIQVDNELDFLRVIEPYNVKILLNGHGHSDLLWTWNGILNTMNKGLYQGSWERIDVDFVRNEVRLARRTEQKKDLTPLATIPLRPARQASGVWTVAGLRQAEPGAPVVARWDDGTWKPVDGEPAPEGLAPGWHRVSFRRRKDEYFAGPVVEVQDPANALKARWTARLTGGIMSHLRLADGVLYVSAMDGSVNALEAATGKPVWTAFTGGYCHSSPLVLDDLVVVGSADQSVHGFDRATGRPRWQFHTGGPVYASAAFAKGTVVIASGDGHVYGLDPKTGHRRWTYALPPSDTAFVQSPAATDGERVFMGAWDNHVYALDAKTGALVWRQGACADRVFNYSAAIGGPAVGGGRVFIPADGNVLYAFDAKTGAPVWNVSAPEDKFGYSGPAYVDGRLYIGCLGDLGQVRCVSAEDGKILWTTAVGATIYDSSPCVSNGHLAIGSVNGLLSVLATGDGRILGQYQMPIGHFLSSPVSEGDAIYAGTYSNDVLGFTLAST